MNDPNMGSGASGIHLEVTGAGPTVILIHPHGYDSRMWRRIVVPLAERFTVVTLDRPGHGHSIDELRVRRARATTLDEYTEQYARLPPGGHEVAEIEDSLTALGVTLASVVGLGDGGMVALMLAARSRVRVDAAVLMNTPVVAPADLTVEQMLDQLAERGSAGPAQVEMVERFVATKDPVPWVDWVLAQDDMHDVPAGDRELMRTMLVDNALSAMFTTAGVGPADLTEELRGVITARVLALRVGARTRETIAPVGPALPRARTWQLDLPDAPGLYPLAHPDSAVRHIADFLGQT